jgi:hypothetical protein
MSRTAAALFGCLALLAAACPAFQRGGVFNDDAALLPPDGSPPGDAGSGTPDQPPPRDAAMIDTPPGACANGDKRCGADQRPETCNGGQWVAGQPCAFACTGRGDCTGNCKPGSGVCMGSVHHTCNENGQWAPDGGTQCKIGLGNACAANGDCQSMVCASGICCNRACSGPCNSCSGADTGMPNGTCAPIKAGSGPRDGQCQTAAPESCGSDGKCDGAGACRKYGATTACGQETCNAAGQLVERGRCDGNGGCTMIPTTCPGSFRCNRTRCETFCATDADCIASHFCLNGACLDRCAGPGPNNHVRPNPGFDGPEVWPDVDDPGARRVMKDALNCERSGAMLIDGTAISSCFAVPAANLFYFGFHAQANRGAGFCGPKLYRSMQECETDGAPPEDFRSINASAGFEPYLGTVSAMGQTVVAAKFKCYEVLDLLIDRLFLNPVSASF